MSWQGGQGWLDASAKADSEPQGVLAGALRELLARMPGRERMTVVDLGCGAGSRLNFLASHFARVIAIDDDDAKLQRAREACSEPSVEFQRCDFRLPLELTARVDIILAMNAARFWRDADHRNLLGSIHDGLVEGGLLLAGYSAALSGGAPFDLSMNGEAGRHPGAGVHEVELQYCICRAGFRGSRVQRFRAVDSRADGLLCMAVRRANN